MHRQFIDLCILLGCDYCETIPKIGPTTALKMIREHKSLEKVIENLGEKYTVPENWPYLDARELFHKPTVTEPKELDYKWEAPDIEGLVKFLVVDKGFNEDRVRSGAARLTKGLKTSTQGERCQQPRQRPASGITADTRGGGGVPHSSSRRFLQTDPKD